LMTSWRTKVRHDVIRLAGITGGHCAHGWRRRR
jgi:hypothetical protein